MHLGRIFAVFTAMALLSGCAIRTAKPVMTRGSVMISRAERVFANGVLCKPGAAAADSLSARLAPLFVKEIGTNVPTEHPVVFTVDAHESEVIVPQGRFIQLTYLWPRRGAAEPPSHSYLQGFRMTLNSTGAPVLWECLPELDGTRVLFVARSLEEAAQRSRGAPAAGRRCAIEAPMEQDPEVVVAGIQDDGPLPMGPMVYIEAGTGAITTILCRCSTAQVLNVSATTQYTLARATTLPMADLSAPPSLTEAQARWLLSPAESLTRGLRLPERF